jgi:hypothetical protein
MYLLYARSYLLVAIPITLAGWYTVYHNGPVAIGGMLFLKLASMLVGWVGLRRRHKKDIFFYQNIGYGEPRLLAVVGAVDFAAWLLGITAIIISYF